MAIYSLHHQPIGKATQAQPHTAAAHVRYITRPDAASHVEGARMPVDAGKAQAYLRQMEDGDRKNARVIDKIRLALPVELDADQRAALVRGFAEELTQGRAPWLAAFHDKGKDSHNPHCHLVVRDRDHEHGRRVMLTSESGSTDRIRALWEIHANKALEMAGREERVDRRTLAAQGIERAPTVHEGPRGQAMEARGVRPSSQRRVCRNGRGARSRTRVVDYPAIDKGRSRSAYNRDTQAAYWAAIDADQRRREFEALGYGADARRYAATTLVSGIQPASVLPAGAEPAVTGGRQRGKSGVPLRSPREPVPFNLFGRVDKPPQAIPQQAEGVKPPQALNVGVNTFGEVTPFPEAVEVARHENKVGINADKIKGSDMGDDELSKKLNEQELGIARHKAEQSKANYENLMERSYRKPAEAQKKMDEYRAKHGNDALYDKLEQNNGKDGTRTLQGNKVRGTSFGQRPGSILSTDGYKPGAGDKRTDSQIARQSLPAAVKDHHRDSERLAKAERAFGGPSPKGGGAGGIGADPTDGSTGSGTGTPAGKPPSFSEKQEQKRQQLASNQEVKAERDSRLAERRAKERDEEKERGR